MVQLVVTLPTTPEDFSSKILALMNSGLGWLRHDKLKHIGHLSSSLCRRQRIFHQHRHSQ